MKIVILGCGRMGSIMARRLSAEGHSISVIDQDADAFRRLENFNGKMVLGNGLDPDVLIRAGIEDADAFVAVTNGDNRNITSVQIAKEIFSVPKVLARIYDPMRAAAYDELGIPTMCTTVIGAGLMADYLLDKQWGDISNYCDMPVD
ncbi:MAG: TrkA family potassium uptake protein [Armatimonadota bacterium]